MELPTEADVYGTAAAHPDQPLYKVTREEDINIANGDSFIPQVPPPACAGALHTVDVADILPDGPNATVNPTFVEIGGSPYEGQQKPLCDTKLVHLSDRKSIAPGFNLFTDVPLPGRFWGLLVDDLNFSSDPQSLGYGEKMGVAFAPVGIYDYTNRLITTVESDYNGLFDVLLPSTNRISCPTPSGVCANLYRFVGNDPGVPGRLNLNYTPQYRTIAAEFEAFPGLTIPADLAPTQVAVGVQIPGSQTLSPVSCALGATAPQLYAINKPYIYTNEISGVPTFTLSGAGFGATRGTGSVKLDNTAMTIVSWSDTQIQFRLPTSGIGSNPYQLRVTANNGQSSVNGLTFHVISPGGGGGGGTYNPTLFIVSDTNSNPDPTHANGRWFKPTIYTDGSPSHAIQNAIEAATNSPRALIVIYPNTPKNDRVNPRGAYYENLVIHSPVKLQGVGPGSPDGSVRGSIIDGSAFGGDTALANDWRALINSLTTVDNTGELVPAWVGNPNVSEGQAIYLLAMSTSQFGSTYRAGIDGLDIRGGDQQGFPGNLNAIFGGYPGPAGGPDAETQGGAIFANAYIRNLQITNNVIEHNGGTFGAIRIGTPNLAAPFTNNENDNLRVAYNRILANGGTNLAGAIGLFNGADGYELDHNDLCGNFSAEYGGAISHFGRNNAGSVAHSTGGTSTPVNEIHDNRIYFNRSYDEGAGIMIAGELPADPDANYNTSNGAKGSGPVNIFNNLIQANLSDDDGGGMRFLMAGNFPMNVYNNMIANNVSTHEGGGIALDDAPNVRFYNNTVMKNVTTATAITSDGQPAPAGLSTGQNSAQLQPTLPGGSPSFSNPLLFNNIFWDNRAGAKGINTVTGITAADANDWDMGVFGAPGSLAPTNSVIQQNAVTYPYTTNASNSAANPAVIDASLEIPLTFTSWRTNVNFTGAIMVTAGLPPTLMGNYHLGICPGSPACNLGAASKVVPSYQQPPATLAAPSTDIDGDARPAGGGYDAGADELPPPPVDLSITKTDGVTTVNAGSAVQYTMVVANAGPNPANGATVADTVPAQLTGATWTCGSAIGGATCAAASGSGNINTTVNLPAGGSVTFLLNGTVASNASGSLANMATVTAPSTVNDQNAANNSATDTDTIIPTLPTVGVLDNFDRANANTLGANWSQVTTGGGSPSAAIRVNTNQATCANVNLLVNCTLNGQAIWNGVTGGGPTYGVRQGAAFTFANTTLTNAALILKVSGGTTTAPANFIRVRYTGSAVAVETTNNGGLSYASLGTLAATFANGDRLIAMANADGSVDVWKTTAANVTTYIGHSSTSSFTGTGRIGMQLPNGARVDNFSGGTLP